jgi:hypothetical protein
MVPPRCAANNDRNIVFLSHVHGGQTPIHAQISTLWSYAYLEDELPSERDARLPALLMDEKKMEVETAWEQQYYRIRYLDFFENVALAPFEGRDILDQLLEDLGLRPDRRAMQVGRHEWFAAWRAWWSEYMGSYGTQEYAGIIDEYRDLLSRR